MRHTYCTLYVVRHGETEWNVQKLLQGHGDSPLTEQGISQVQSLATKLQNIHFDAVFSSDLLRAKKTAEIISLEKKMVVTTTKALRERSYGRYEGKPFKEFSQDLREMLLKYEQLTEEGKKTFKYAEDIESDDEVITRVLLYLREICIAYLGKTILTVTHGGVITMLLTHLGHMTYSEQNKIKVQNAAYIQLKGDGSDFFIEDTYGIDKLV